MQNYVNLTKGGGFSANRWNICRNFCSYIYTIFFRNSPTDQTPRWIFVCNGSNSAVSHMDVPFWG